MCPVSKVASSSFVLVRQVIERRQVQKDLKDRGFRAFLYGTNIYILNRLSVEQYKSFLRFLDVIKEFVQKNYVLREGELIPLTLPWPGKLQKIDFERLLENSEAMDKVYEICVFPQGKTRVDLTNLSWVYKEYVATK